MLISIKHFFDKLTNEEVKDSESNLAERIQVATCVLLLETAYSDRKLSKLEENRIIDILKKEFGLNDDLAIELIKIAEEKRKESLDLWEFTNLINENYSIEEKIKVIETVWKVIYLDGKLDEYEDYLVHKLQHLLNLEHKQLIDAKMKVLNSNS